MFPLKNDKVEQVASFLQENIFSHFGLLLVIVSDNGGFFLCQNGLLACVKSITSFSLPLGLIILKGIT